MTFYDRVNELCRERGISITALALALGFSKGTPSNWKTMTKPPRAENVKKVAEYFGVTVASLMGDSVVDVHSVHNNNGIIGNTHAPVTINGAPELALGDIEKELLSICGKLDMKRKNALLAKAYELLEEKV